MDRPVRDPLAERPTWPGGPCPDDTYTCYAAHWHGGRFVPVVVRDRDMHEIWGDAPIPAATPADMPAAVQARLALTGWRIVGPWVAAPIGVDPHRIRAAAEPREA